MARADDALGRAVAHKAAGDLYGGVFLPAQDVRSFSSMPATSGAWTISRSTPEGESLFSSPSSVASFPTRRILAPVWRAASIAPGTTTEGPRSPPMASTAITVLLLLIGGLLFNDLTTAVGAAAGAGSVGNRGGSAGAIHNGGGGHAIVRPAHTLLGMGLLILLYGHDGTP